ncbi:MAG: hypothetical protein ACLRT5_07430 [Lachnospiraceae bacterium]
MGENIAIASDEEDSREIRSAASIACVDDAIRQFKDGYEYHGGRAGRDPVRRPEAAGGHRPDADAEGSHYGF